MRRQWLMILAGVVGLGLAAAPAHGQIEVGVARVNITPEYPIRLSGYLSRTRESEGVAQRIWAKALAVRPANESPVVLVSVDNVGVPREVVERVAANLEKKVQLPRHSFVVAASHTHSAPCLTGLLPNIFGKPIPENEQATIDRYTRELTDQLEQVSLLALNDLRPARLEWAQGQVGFANNRRSRGGPVDRAMPVLRATDASGALRAVVVNYACHCTTVNPDDNQISGDWAGYAQDAIEHDHPGAIAMTVVGCGADANPRNRLAPGAARANGRAIADELNRLLKDPAGKNGWTALGAPLVRHFAEISLPFDTLPTRAQLEALVKKGGPPGYNASVQLARLDRGEPLQSAIAYPVQVWAFRNDLAMVFLSGEVVVDYALRLKKEFDPARLWVTAYANDVPCYIPSERILKEGGYEAEGAMVYYGRPARLKAGLEDSIITTVARLIPAGFRAGSRAEKDPGGPPPQSPEEAMRSFHLGPRFRIELVAAEPLVLDPVAIDFGADGKLWVCEMRDYPAGIDGKWTPGGVIKVLEDRDRDGRYETATSFLEGLPFPTGVMAWRKGALVCAAPEILYAEDTDGDGKADLRKVLFRGFATENYQARVNGLSYALDNWVYGANGLIGGTIHGMATGREINIGGRDFRILPDTGVMEPASGLTQQGRIHDDWSNQFGNNNSVLLQHYPFPDHYARRNPHVPTPVASVYVPRDPESQRIYPTSRTLERFNQPQSANRVTSACGPAIYRDRLLGAAYEGNAFTCEPVHNLVHREVLTADGITFAGHRAQDEATSEFLASTDNWFRPVQVRTGPDGALWVVDMYRFVIEHPRWISPQQLAALDVRAGADKGRIYRILPEGTPPRPVPVLDHLATPELARQLESPNGTLRDNVQRLLVHRQDKAAVPVLKDLAAHSENSACRMQALCTLEGLGALESVQVAASLADRHAGVRRQAVRLAEPFLGQDEAVGAAVLELTSDPDPTVRFQLALSLGQWNDRRAGEALGQLLRRHGTRDWLGAAVLSSATKQPAPILAAVVSEDADPLTRQTTMGPLIATAMRSPSVVAFPDLLDSLPRPRPGRPIPTWWFALAAEVVDGPARDTDPLPSTPFWRALFAQARTLAVDEKQSVDDRTGAIRLLGHERAHRSADIATLAGLLGPRNHVQIQSRAVKALARLRTAEADRRLIEAWPQMSPEPRARSLDALLGRKESAGQLLAALERQAIAPGEIDATHRQQLLQTSDPALRGQAEAIFAAVRPRARAQVLAAYAPALTLRGDPERGRQRFAKVCAACHRLDGQGHEVGPDLAALTDKSPEALLTAILDPNKEVDARYASYTAALEDGRVVTGLIAAETANAMTLKRQEGVLDVLLRSELEAIKTTGQSLMPEGLETDLKPADLADLIAYLQSGGPQPKVLAGNHPERVRQSDEGPIRLTAQAAEIYGPTLTFESQFGNLGLWHSAEDRAAWSFQVERGGTFTVTIEWACANESAGNTFEIKVGGKSLKGTVDGTGAGTWSRYRSIFVGETTLPAGPHRLELRPAGPVHNALFDLRGVTLTPRLPLR